MSDYSVVKVQRTGGCESLPPDARKGILDICPFTYRRFGGGFAPCFYDSDENFFIFFSAAVMLLDTFW